jgi:mono/diheme cytochrome c family protein
MLAACLTAGLASGLISAGCGGDTTAQPELVRPDWSPDQPGDPAVGARIYRSHCTACHNPDPAFPGTIGPEILGAPRPLVEARVMRAEYPVGHVPKRTTHNMVAMPQLEPYLDDLTAFLNQPAR